MYNIEENYTPITLCITKTNKMNLEEASKRDLLQELIKRLKSEGTDILNSESNSKVLSELDSDPNLNFNISLTFGLPDTLSHDKYRCSRCDNKKETKCFRFYQSRVDKDGYLMRSNALCDTCSVESNKRRAATLSEAHRNGEISDRPKEGDTCPHCSREWYGNWHRHHDDVNHKFIEWLCGDCNMSFHDQRNPKY
jgi:hypothetical protein